MNAEGTTAPMPNPALRVAVLGVLADVRAWRLGGPRWPEVEQLLADLETALADAAFDDAAAVVAELEMLSPTRMIPAGSAPRAEAPPTQVIVRLNHLVHTLGGVSARPDPSR